MKSNQEFHLCVCHDELSLILAKSKAIVYNKHRKSTHSKADAPEKVTYLSVRGASPVDQTGGALFFSPVLPISVEKGKQRHNQAAKGHQQSQYPYENRDDLISRHKRHRLRSASVLAKQVPLAPSNLPMYSGKPVSLAQEATTLSWVLFHERIIAKICRIDNQAFRPLALRWL